MGVAKVGVERYMPSNKNHQLATTRRCKLVVQLWAHSWNVKAKAPLYLFKTHSEREGGKQLHKEAKLAMYQMLCDTSSGKLEQGKFDEN